MVTIQTTTHQFKNITTVFEKRKPAYTELKEFGVKNNVDAIISVTYLGKRKDEPIGHLTFQVENKKNTSDSFYHNGSRYKRIPATTPGSCGGCDFTNQPCNSELMPTRPSCSGFVFVRG